MTIEANLDFSFNEAKRKLFEGLPGVKNLGSGCLIYDRPSYSIGSGMLSKNELKAEIDRAIEKGLGELRDLKIDGQTVDADFIKTLPTEIQYRVYSHYYWTHKNNPSLVKFLKHNKVYSGTPHFTKDNSCLACDKIFTLKFTKSGLHHSECPYCGHSNKKNCICDFCSKPDKIVRNNINVLFLYIDDWIRLNDENAATKDEVPIDHEWARLCVEQHAVSKDEIKKYVLKKCNILVEAPFGGVSRDYLLSARMDLETIIIQSFRSCPIRTNCLTYTDILEAIKRENKKEYKWSNFHLSKELTPRSDLNVLTNLSDSLESMIGKYKKGSSANSDSKVFVLTGSRNSNGYKDFVALCEGEIEFKPNFFDSRNENGLYECIANLGAKKNDTVVIVRGGGDVTHESFNAFKSTKAVDAIDYLKCIGVFVIVGVGHSSDSFPIDKNASISAITPTDAAYKLLQHLKGIPGKSRQINIT